MKKAPNSNNVRAHILLVDDHPIVRMGVRRLLELSGRMQVVAETGTGEDARKLYMAHTPDVVLMDLSLPTIGGLEAIRLIIKRDPTAKILVFTIHEDPLLADRALRAGAVGYLLKNCSVGALTPAVEEVLGGGLYLDPKIAKDIAVNNLKGRRLPLDALSDREVEIFRHVAQGRSRHEIAALLNLTAKTVSNYTGLIKKKLDVGTNAQITRLAMKNGLIN